MERRNARRYAVIDASGILIVLSLTSGAGLWLSDHAWTINDVFRTDTRIGPVTLYRVLQKLASNELIEEAEDALGEGEDERRKLYRLTPLGYGVAAKIAATDFDAPAPARLRERKVTAMETDTIDPI